MHLEPLFEGFNQAVLKMVSVYLPEGFDTTSEQTESYGEMREEWLESGRVTVNTDFSERTIFGSPHVNWSFRAWHDYCHLLGDYDFSKNGEWFAAFTQKTQLSLHYAGNPNLPLWLKLIDIEVNGQLEYYLGTGEFPEDQRAFTLERL